MDFPPGIRHRTFFIAGRIDVSCNGSRFVAIAYGAARRTAWAASTDPHQDERTRSGAMPKSRRQGRGRRWRGPLSQHRPRHVRRLQVANLVAPHLHRARGREGRFFQPGALLVLPDFPRRAQNSSGCRNGLARQTFAQCAGGPALVVLRSHAMSCRGAACCKAHPSSSRATLSGEGARQGGWQFSMTRPRISPLCGKRCCWRRGRSTSSAGTSIA